MNKNILYRCQTRGTHCNQRSHILRDQACYIVNDGKAKRRYVEIAAATEYGPFVKSYTY